MLEIFASSVSSEAALWADRKVVLATVWVTCMGVCHVHRFVRVCIATFTLNLNWSEGSPVLGELVNVLSFTLLSLHSCQMIIFVHHHRLLLHLRRRFCTQFPASWEFSPAKWSNFRRLHLPEIRGRVGIRRKSRNRRRRRISSRRECEIDRTQPSTRAPSLEL